MISKNIIRGVVVSTMLSVCVLAGVQAYRIQIHKAHPVVEVNQLTYEETVFADVQEWRRDVGKPEYKVDDKLCELAEERSEEIINYWSHDGFKGLIFKTEFKSLGENLSKDFVNPHNVLNAWLQSELHRNNLEADYTSSCLECTVHNMVNPVLTWTQGS